MLLLTTWGVQLVVLGQQTEGTWQAADGRWVGMGAGPDPAEPARVAAWDCQMPAPWHLHNH